MFIVADFSYLAYNILIWFLLGLDFDLFWTDLWFVFSKHRFLLSWLLSLLSKSHLGCFKVICFFIQQAIINLLSFILNLRKTLCLECYLRLRLFLHASYLWLLRNKISFWRRSVGKIVIIVVKTSEVVCHWLFLGLCLVLDHSSHLRIDLDEPHLRLCLNLLHFIARPFIEKCHTNSFLSSPTSPASSVDIVISL